MLTIFHGVSKIALLYARKKATRRALLMLGISITSVIQWQRYRFYKLRNKEIEERRKYREDARQSRRYSDWEDQE